MSLNPAKTPALLSQTQLGSAIQNWDHDIVRLSHSKCSHVINRSRI